MLSEILTITGRFICSVNSYCDNNENNGGGCIYAMLTVIGIFAVLTVIVTITGS